MELQFLLDCFQYDVLLWMTIGSLVGLVLGALPGIGPETGIALFIPITFNLPPTVALPCLAAIYVSGVFGGNIPAILINTPGEPDSIFIALEGYPMTLMGKGQRAIIIAAIGAFIGGMTGGFALLLLSPHIANLVVILGPLELFLLTMIGISVIVTLSQKSLIKGFLSAFLGFAFSFIGTDTFTSEQRFTFGILELMDGVPILSVIIGFFAISQMLSMVSEGKSVISSIDKIEEGAKKIASFNPFRALRESKGLIFPTIRGSIIGTLIGIAPGPGGTTATGLTYSLEKRLSKRPEKFGNGSEEGLISMCASCNAVVGGTLVPLITLSIPGSSTAALFLGGLMVHGLSPGERLFTAHANIVYVFMFSMILAQFFILIFGILGSKWFARITTVQNSILIPIILVFTVIGSFAARGQMFDVFLIVIVGLIGFWWEKIGIPLTPFVLAFVLGPGAENKFRRAVLLLESDFFRAMIKPVPLLLLAINLSLIILPLIASYSDYKKEKAGNA